MSDTSLDDTHHHDQLIHLEVLRGDLSPQISVFDSRNRWQILIGRSPTCNLHTERNHASGHLSANHAAITCEHKKCWLKDLNSTNGTRLVSLERGSQALQPGIAYELHHKDKIILAETVHILYLDTTQITNGTEPLTGLCRDIEQDGVGKNDFYLWHNRRKFYLNLANREYRLLGYLYENQGKLSDKLTCYLIMQKRDLAAGIDLSKDPSWENTLQRYVSNIRQKFNRILLENPKMLDDPSIPSEQNLIMSIRGEGYLLKLFK